MALASIQATPEIITSDQYDHTDVREEAIFLYNQGFSIVRKKKRSKYYADSNWQQRTYKPSDFSTDDNIAIRLGSLYEKGTLIAVDIDIPSKYKRIIESIIETLNLLFGETPIEYSGGKSRAPHLYYLSNSVLNENYLYETPYGKIELMATSSKTLLTAPSVVETVYTRKEPLVLQKLPVVDGRQLAQMLESHAHRLCDLKEGKSSKESVKIEESQVDDWSASEVKGWDDQVAPMGWVFSSLGAQDYTLESSLRLSNSLSLWRALLRDHRWPSPWSGPVAIGQPLNCVLHPESRPSARLYQRDTGMIVYADFHTGKSYDVIEMFTALCLTGEDVPLRASSPAFLSYWSTRLKNYIQENNIITGLATAFNRYRTSLELSFLPPLQRQTLVFLLQKYFEELNKGNSYFLASKRYLADSLDISDKSAVVVTNQLSLMGVLYKGAPYKIQNAPKPFYTPKFSICPLSQSDIEYQWHLLEEQDLTLINSFSKHTVAKVRGPEVANVLFRSDPKDSLYDGSVPGFESDKMPPNPVYFKPTPADLLADDLTPHDPDFTLVQEQQDQEKEHLISDRASLHSIFESLNSYGEIACGLQSVSEESNHLHFFSLANKTESFTIDWLSLDESGKALFSDFISKDRSYIFQNAKAGFKLMENECIPLPTNFFDIYLAEKLINHNYKPPVNFPVESLLAKKASLTQLLHNYQLMDTASLEFKTLFATLRMEKNGIGIDIDRVQQLHDEMKKQQEHLEAIIYENIGKEIKLNSPQQLLEVLSKRGYDLKDTEKKTLSPLAENEPLIADILDFRKIKKQLEKPNEIIGTIDKGSNRIYSHYNQLGGETGRFSCADFNIQQVPKNKAIRNCFIPADGNVFVVADYSQIELRIAAEISNDTNMIQAYVDDKDFHTETAALINDIAPEQVTPEMRKAAKALNFGILFGMGAKSFVEKVKNDYGIQITKDQAKEYIKRFFDAYPDFKHWKKTVMKNYDMRTLGTRGFFNVKKKYTQRLNFPIQGSEADILKTALCLLTERLKGTTGKIVACIHDEIILECAKEEGEQMKQILQNSMEEAGRVYLKRVPVVAEAEIRKSWAD